MMGVVMGEAVTANSSDQRAVATFLARSRRKTAPPRSFSDWYAVALAGLLLSVAIGSFVALRPLTPGCATSMCLLGAEVSSLAELLGFAVVVFIVAVLSGPVSVTAAEAFWLFSSPLARNTLLARRKAGLLIRSTLAGAVAGVLHLVFWNGNPWWLPAFTMGAVFAMCLAMLVQGGHAGVRRTVLFVLTVGAVLAGVAAGSPAATVAVSSPLLPGVVVLGGGLLVALTARRAWRRADSLTSPELRRARSEGDAVAGALSSADSGLLLDVVSARLLTNRTFVSRLSVNGSGWRAILMFEIQRCLRSPLLLTRVLLVVAALAVTHLGGVPGLLVGIAISTMVFASLSASAFRLYATSRGLARSFPHTATVMRLLLVLPTTLLVVVLVVGFSLAASLLPGPPTPNGIAIAAATIAGLVGGMRWATAAPTQFSAGVLMTEMGPIHVSALLNAIRGIDVVLLLVIPLAVGLDPWVPLSIALLVWLWVLLRS